MNTNQMLQALANSDNENCASLAKAILKGETTVEVEQTRGHGSFMSAVLRGDYDKALRNADYGNRAALVKWLLNNKVEI